MLSLSEYYQFPFGSYHERCYLSSRYHGSKSQFWLNISNSPRNTVRDCRSREGCYYHRFQSLRKTVNRCRICKNRFFFSFVFVLALITPVQTCFVCLTSFQLFAWRTCICVKTRLVSTKISEWHVRLERKHMRTAIILNKRNVCLWICLDSKRLAHWEETSKHNKPMTIDSQYGRKINTKTNFLSSFFQFGFRNERLQWYIVVSFVILWKADGWLLFIFFNRWPHFSLTWSHVDGRGLDAIGWVLGQNSFCPSDIEKTHPGEDRNVGIYKQASSDRTR